MIHLVYSNRTEELTAALVEHLGALRAGGRHPLDPVELVVPNRNMEAYLRFRVAETLGVTANLRFRRLERFVKELVAESGSAFRLVDHETLEGGILAVLQSLESDQGQARELAPLARYLGSDPGGDGRELRRAQLVSRLAQLFDEYHLSRTEMIAAWPHGPDLGTTGAARLEAWQRALWLRLFGPGGELERNPPPGAGSWLTVGELARGKGPERLARGGPLLVFGVSYLARVYQQLFARLATEAGLILYTLNPCRELWEDVETPGEHRRRLRRARRGSGGELPEGAEEDPYGLFRDTDNPPLRLWGRPGREGMRLFDELTDCDFEDRFRDPLEDGHSLLRQLQQDILERREQRREPPDPPLAPDGTLRFLPCPSVRREVETVAEEIWRLVSTSTTAEAPPLRFSDIAVIVNGASRERYVPQIEAAFEELHGIPRSVTDLPLLRERRLVEAAGLLLELPFGRFGRGELLRVMNHPAVAGRFDDLVPGEWARLADALGIYFGADRQDLAGTYLDGDLTTWDQGIRRLALGAFMTGERSGDLRTLEAAGESYLVHEIPAGRRATAGRFGLLARSLLADAREVGRQRRSLSDWAAAFRELFLAYLNPADEGEEGDLLRCLEAMETLERMDLAGIEVSGRLAVSAALRALSRLAGGRGSFMAEGVVVSSFLPMRAIPFRAIFILGLGEGLFPAANRRDALDLRGARRRAGDVTPAERDRYMFLETLLSARDHLFLSWVARDEHSGEPLHPSGVVQELRHLLAQDYVGEAGLKALTREPSRSPALATAEGAPERPGATAEAAARRLGRAARAALPGLPARDALEVLRSHLGEEGWRPLARFLLVPELGSPTPPLTGPQARSLPFSALRALLECPLQASASAVLGLDREQDDDLSEREDEPLVPAPFEEAMLLREAMGRALRRGEEPHAVYREMAHRRRLAGTLPAGILGEIAAQRHEEILEGWRRALAAQSLDPRGARRLRIGPAPELEEVDMLIPALEISIDPRLPGDSRGHRLDPQPETPGGRLVRLLGPSPLLLGDPPILLYLEPRSPRGSLPLERCPRLLIRAYVDHLALAAAGLGEGERRLALVMRRSATRPLVARVMLEPLGQSEARALLAELATDLLEGTHDAPFPCEAVFEAWRAADRNLPAIDGATLVEEVRQCLLPHGRCSSRYGPIANPERHPPPPPELTAALALRRFTPLFRLVQWEGR